MQGEGARAVSPDEGAAFARQHGCMYKETSAKTDTGGTDEGVYDALVWGERRVAWGRQTARGSARRLCSIRLPPMQSFISSVVGEGGTTA